MKDQENARNQTLALLERYQMLIMSKDWDNWIELWADDGVCEFPFAPKGHVQKLVGKSDILDYMSGYPGEIEIENVLEMRVHAMAEPNVISAELSVSGRVASTGRPYNQSYVVFIETEGGKIAKYREYWNPLVTIEAYGSLDAWLSHAGADGNENNA